jgi:hypothetical protein
MSLDKRSTRLFRILAIVGALTCANASFAEEGGSGHYLPGSMASFIDGVPSTETFLTRLNVIDYDGSVGGNVRVPIGGLSTLGADAKSRGYGLTILWRPPIDMGEKWSYAMSATIPILTMDVSANVLTTGPGGGPITVKRSDSQSGVGDLVLIPLMLNYNVDRDFNVNFRVAAYAPTGDYEVGRLANTGKNFWTAEPTLALMYLGQKNGREASLFVGADFNEENSDTNYKSGTQFHLDGTLAQHFPAFGGLAGVGVSAYYYKQVTGDSGDGATLGDFEAKTVGIGPVISYTSKLASHDVVAEFKWLHETDTEKRLEGDILWLKVVFKFY